MGRRNRQVLATFAGNGGQRPVSKGVQVEEESYQFCERNLPLRLAFEEGPD